MTSVVVCEFLLVFMEQKILTHICGFHPNFCSVAMCALRI
jgi:hypothetical protein